MKKQFKVTFENGVCGGGRPGWLLIINNEPFWKGYPRANFNHSQALEKARAEFAAAQRDLWGNKATFEDLSTPPQCERDASVLEALADIAYVAGENRFHTGDSRQDIQTIIDIAFAFELKYAGTEWGEELDYIETVTQFAYDELIRVTNEIKNT